MDANKFFKVVVKSIWGDAGEEDLEEGVFEIIIPQEYARKWRDAIKEVGKRLQAWREDKPIQETDSVLPKGFYKEHQDRVEDAIPEGASLPNILDVLGWEYQRVIEDVIFDPDYNVFRD